MAERDEIEGEMLAGDFITYESFKEKYGVGIVQSSGSDAGASQG